MVLYQHQDGRYGLAATPEDADFAVGDPGWNRVPLDEVRLAEPAVGQELREAVAAAPAAIRALLDDLARLEATAAAYAHLHEEEQAEIAQLRSALDAPPPLPAQDLSDEQIDAIADQVFVPSDPRIGLLLRLFARALLEARRAR